MIAPYSSASYRSAWRPREWHGFELRSVRRRFCLCTSCIHSTSSCRETKDGADALGPNATAGDDDSERALVPKQHTRSDRGPLVS